MTIDQEWISDVLTNHRSLIYIHIVDVIHEVDTSTLACVGWLHNPNILFAFMLFQFLVVVVEVTKLIRQDVCVRAEIKSRFAESFLHTHYVETQSIFASDLITLREMVNLLVLIQAFILV